MIKGMIFDLGGVIIESYNLKTYKYIGEKYGIDTDIVKKRLVKKLPLVQTGKLSEKEWVGEFFRSVGIEPPKGYEKIWGDHFKTSKRNEAVLKIIKNLKGRYKLAILSNTEPSRAAWERKRGTTNHFDAVIFSCEVGVRKDDDLRTADASLDIYRIATRAIGLLPKQCVYVDDKQECVKDAERVGMKGILFTNAKQLKVALEKYGVVV